MTFSYGGYDNKSIGLLGSCFYFLFFLICLWRSFVIWRDEDDFDSKIIFHLVLTGNALLELIYFVAMLIYDG